MNPSTRLVYLMARLSLLVFPVVISSTANQTTAGMEDDVDLVEYGAHSIVLDFEHDLNGIPDDNRPSTQAFNRQVLSKAIHIQSVAAEQEGKVYSQGQNDDRSAAFDFIDQFQKKNFTHVTIVVPPKTFHLEHGVHGSNIKHLTLQVDGTLKFHRRLDGIIPANEYHRPLPCILLEDSDHITFTSSHDDSRNDDTSQDGQFAYGNVDRGIVDGSGPEFWGIPGIGYIQLNEFRPDLLVMNRTTNVLIEYLIFRDAPLYTLHLVDMNVLTIRYISIVARRSDMDGHGLIDLTAFNTDGIDVSGHNVHIHDADIWNQDDCIAVKDSFTYGMSTNMTFERIAASGLGLTIGSIGNTHVKNITFRDCILYKSYKGIYLKFRPEDYGNGGIVEDIMFDRITMEEPIQWAIWIGPAQQSISANICKASPCSLCWPEVPFASCDGIENSLYRNITLRNVLINNPLNSPGVIIGGRLNPIDGLIFDNVVVTKGGPAMNIDRHNIFYGLKQPIDDPFINPLLYAFVGGVLLVMIILVLQCLLRIGVASVQDGKKDEVKEVEPEKRPLIIGATDQSCKDRGTMDDSPKQGCFSWIVWFTLTVLSAAILSQVFLNVSGVHDVNSYFECIECAHCVARGNTWPVPSCFEDETHN